MIFGSSVPKITEWSSIHSPFANIFNDSDEDELNLLTEESANVPVRQYTDLIELGRCSPLAEKKVRNILQLSRYLITHKGARSFAPGAQFIVSDLFCFLKVIVILQ